MAELIGWVDPDTVEAHWPDSVLVDPDGMVSLLKVAHETCAAYAPAVPLLEDGTAGPIPERYKVAQILQARAVWAMQRQSPGETFDGAGFSVAVYPLDARIRAMLRPKRPFGGLR
jgi:hypothetical protein